MGLKTIEYETLGDLLDHEAAAEEDPQTMKIIRRLQHVKHDRELSRGEFLDICYWKSTRSIRQCERNSASVIELASQKVLSTRSERRRIELLTGLHGVSIPTASAILTLTDTDNYGVIDIRVWQLLYVLNSIQNNARGQGFTFEHWYRYLKILRHHAHRLNRPVRIVELTLFKFHQPRQQGRLYEA